MLVWPTLNEGQNSSKSHKNRCPCLSLKWVSKSTLTFQYGESRQNCIFSTLVWPTLHVGQNTFEYHKNTFPWLSLKWVLKSTFKTQFRESWQKCIFSTLVCPTLNEGQNSSKSHKIGVHVYLSNASLNPLSKLNSEKVDKTAYSQPWSYQPWTGAKIAPNIVKIGVHAYLSNGYLNPLSKLNSEKVDKSTYF